MNIFSDNLAATLGVVIAVLAAVGLFFFMLTRVSLILQTKSAKADPDTAHIYWIYKSPFFIRLTDRMFVVQSILLFQYSNLVSGVVKRLNPSLKGKRVLQVSCAFGNVSEKIAETCAAQGAEAFVLTDIMQSELDNAERKLPQYNELCSYVRTDATNMEFEDESFDYVVSFFLPHELPFEKKIQHLEEAKRVLKPGGKIVFGEFHKPSSWLMEKLGRIYFYVFEPYAVEMWDSFDLSEHIKANTDASYTFEHDTFLFDNFQVLAAKKAA